MRIGVIGSGISGLTAAWLLAPYADVHIFERDARFGGHTDTHRITIDNQNIAVDSGFIVYNEHNYPHFSYMMKALSVRSEPSDMSLAIDDRVRARAYNPSRGYSLLYSPKLLLQPDFRQMLREIMRFYREAGALDDQSLADTLTVADYLADHGYSERFAEEHLYPMCGALWSASAVDVGALPLRFVLGFMRNHRMLQIKERPQWRTISGGSEQYIYAIKQTYPTIKWRASPVTALDQTAAQARIVSGGQAMSFDAVIVATRAPDALEVIQDPSVQERSVLGAFSISQNDMVVHSDPEVMARDRRLWASWNVGITGTQDHPQYSIHYWMNRLQNLPIKTPLIASLNPTQAIDPNSIWVRRQYEHPRYDAKSLSAQSQWSSLVTGQTRRFYAGAYWGWGFHEDGAASAHRAVRAMLAQIGAHQTLDLLPKIDGIPGAIC